jgi:hypothetical protein
MKSLFEALKGEFNNDITKAEAALEKSISETLINFTANLSQVAAISENDKQALILVNSYMLSLIVNMAFWKLTNELRMAKEANETKETMINICRMNIQLFGQTHEQILTKLDDIIKKEIGENVAFI